MEALESPEGELGFDVLQRSKQIVYVLEGPGKLSFVLYKICTKSQSLI